MRIEVRFFGRLSELVAPEPVHFDVEAGATATALRVLIAAGSPRAADALRTAMVAVNAEYSSDGTVLKDGDVVAFLPPVSGG